MCTSVKVTKKNLIWCYFQTNVMCVYGPCHIKVEHIGQKKLLWFISTLNYHITLGTNGKNTHTHKKLKLFSLHHRLRYLTSHEIIMWKCKSVRRRNTGDNKTMWCDSCRIPCGKSKSQFFCSFLLFFFLFTITEPLVL